MSEEDPVMVDLLKKNAELMDLRAQLTAERERSAELQAQVDTKRDQCNGLYGQLQAERERADRAEERATTFKKWANIGGAPSGRICRYNPQDVHEIHGPGFSKDAEGNDSICLLHYQQQLESSLGEAKADVERKAVSDNRTTYGLSEAPGNLERITQLESALEEARAAMQLVYGEIPYGVSRGKLRAALARIEKALRRTKGGGK